MWHNCDYFQQALRSTTECTKKVAFCGCRRSCEVKSGKLTHAMLFESVSLGCEDNNLWVWSPFFFLEA